MPKYQVTFREVRRFTVEVETDSPAVSETGWMTLALDQNRGYERLAYSELDDREVVAVTQGPVQSREL